MFHALWTHKWMHAYLLVWPQRSVPRALSWHRSLWSQNNRRPALWSDCSCNNPPWRSALKACSFRFCGASMGWFMIQIIIKAKAAVSPSFPVKVHRCFVFLQRTAWTVAALSRTWFAEIWIAKIIQKSYAAYDSKNHIHNSCTNGSNTTRTSYKKKNLM